MYGVSYWQTGLFSQRGSTCYWPLRCLSVWEEEKSSPKKKKKGGILHFWPFPPVIQAHSCSGDASVVLAQQHCWLIQFFWPLDSPHNYRSLGGSGAQHQRAVLLLSKGLRQVTAIPAFDKFFCQLRVTSYTRSMPRIPAR